MKDAIQQPMSSRETAIQMAKFVVFSISAGIIQIISFSILNEFTQMPYWPAYLIALILSIIYNFTVNRRFTFKSANNVPVAMMKVFGYYMVFTPASTWWGDVLTDAGWNEYLVLLGTMAVNLTTEYVFARFVVYRNSMNTNELAGKYSVPDQE